MSKITLDFVKEINVAISDIELVDFLARRRLLISVDLFSEHITKFMNTFGKDAFTEGLAKAIGDKVINFLLLEDNLQKLV